MLHQLPLFQQLEDAQNILIAGAGGGFDIFCGLPLYYNLIRQGKNVTLANYSFTPLSGTSAEEVYPRCYKISATDKDLKAHNYLPEKYLCHYLLTKGMNPPVYAFEKTGVNPLKRAYRHIIDKHHIDTIILVDGGTDSLMFGDEEGLGTPLEDICSMAAVYKTGIKRTFLVSLGFGIDHFHGVSHYRFLENIAELMRDDGYLGSFQLSGRMEEAVFYKEAVDFVNQKMPGLESIVSNSIVSALDGHFGNVHRTRRTDDSELWINPLMTFYWCFELAAVVKHIRYFNEIRDTNTLNELKDKLADFRSRVDLRPSRQMPI